MPPLSVKESSTPGTLVGTFTANDADKNGTLNTKITYSLVKQEPAESKVHFYIEKDSGAIHVKEDLLDRERQSSYTLTVKGVDMGGAPDGRSGTGTIQIKVTDINDNVPTLEQDSYSAHIKENEQGKEVLRMQALDNDEAPTTNWLAEFEIVTGNEDGIFTISTDPVTNEGILRLVKPVDFELNPDIQLGVIVSNVAPAAGAGLGAGGGADSGGGGGGDGDGDGDGDMDLDIDADLGIGVGAGLNAGAGLDAGAGLGVGVRMNAGVNVGAGSTGGTGINAPGANAGLAPNTEVGAATGASGSENKKTTKKRPVKGKVYDVNIEVENVIEGATFIPAVMPVQVSEKPEELPEDGVIAVYRATSDETGEPADNVIYAKDYDPESLLIVDPDTAEIKLQKVPDRESPFVVNGTYYAKILSITKDAPYTTSTGTLALQVKDSNDNCPTLTSTLKYVCEDTHVINITGHDEDEDPNGAPLSFRVVTEKTRGNWRVQPIDGTHASLHSSTPFWAEEVHQIWLEVLDQQGLSCPEPQNLEVRVCLCEDVDACAVAASVLEQRDPLKESAATLGALGAGVMILALLILLRKFCSTQWV
ncbi:desmoglein-2.1-like [Periophthalmus magnuspinnatus]|uniref:desmoglein-2.1-like n=1 Tax=Periophthalmus magnuspinnatus TaxID=409849 RepID=UPI002437415C|nr:desmoglein-2.1-like [Periophthalmus magnuspinnatus]